MENQTDTDAPGPIATGVGVSEQNPRMVHQIQPNWVVDGYGIRGPQRQVIQPDIRKDPMTFGLPIPSQPIQTDDPSGNPCMEAAGDPPGSGTWVLGSVDGTCQWIDTTTCP